MKYCNSKMKIQIKYSFFAVFLASFFIVFFQNATIVAPKCILPEELEKNVGKHWFNKDLYLIENSLLLCPNQVYSRGIYINTSNITIDCQNATFQSNDKLQNGFFIENADNVKISNCTFKDFKGNIAVRNYRRSGINPLNGQIVAFSQLGEDASFLYDKDDPRTYSYAPLDNIVLNNVKVLNHEGGTLMRIQNSTIKNSVFDGGGLGFYLEADSHHNVITHSTFSNSTLREGLILDGSYENTVTNNKIFNNRTNGIVLYKNCGEDMGLWTRKNSASRNIIKNNYIYGHNKRTKSVITISEGAGIAVALRQGLSFIGKRESLTSNSDSRCHMFPWYRVNEEVFEKFKADEMYKISLGELSFLKQKKFYIGPHWDFADENVIENNILFDNLIGIYVAGKNTTIIRNRFFKSYSDPLWNGRDLIFGNYIADSINKPILGLTLEENLFNWTRKPQLFASSNKILDSIVFKNNNLELSKSDFMTLTLKESFELLEVNSPDKSKSLLFQFLSE